MDQVAKRAAVTLASMFLLCIVATGRAKTPEQELQELAKRFVDQQLAYDPALSYFTGLPVTEHNRFADRTPKALAVLDEQEREDLRQLGKIDARTLPDIARATYANLREQLESNLGLRVCRSELWNVNHFDGWQSTFVEIAERQPVDTAAERQMALQRWASMPRFVEVEIANLESGLAQGYSAPRAVVERVIPQIDELAASAPEQSPLFSPAMRSNDADFKQAFRQVLTEKVDPSLRRYSEYLRMRYLARAREGVAISDLPDGAACYQAILRANTTLPLTPQQVFDLGEKTVAANVAEIKRLGQEQFGSSDIEVIVSSIRKKPEERFAGPEELLAFSKEFLSRVKQQTALQLMSGMPRQDVVIRPLPGFEERAGVGSRFEQQPDEKLPAVYLLKLGSWRGETRAEAEIATVHETVPGHYLQKALARELGPSGGLEQLADYPAYAEGWARYAEEMAEEVGIYDTPDAAILRRVWRARGMVVDPGLHAFHWTREQAIRYMVASGRFNRAEANDYVDRIAVMPGQLTSYDVGALEMESLRREAKGKLGARFDLRQFNRVVLEEGVVPLGELRAHVSSWVAREQRQ